MSRASSPSSCRCRRRKPEGRRSVARAAAPYGAADAPGRSRGSFRQARAPRVRGTALYERFRPSEIATSLFRPGHQAAGERS